MSHKGVLSRRYRFFHEGDVSFPGLRSVFVFLHSKLLVICMHRVTCPLCALLVTEPPLCPPFLCADSLQTLRALISSKGDFPAFLGALHCLSPGPCISFSHYHIILKVSLYLTPLLYCKLPEGRQHCHFHLCFVFFFSPQCLK